MVGPSPARRVSVAGAPLELVAEQVPQVVEDARLDRRVQPVAAVVDPDPVQLEAGRDPPGAGRPLQHHHPVPGPGRPVGGAHPGRPGTEDDEVGGWRHAADATRANLDK